MSPLLLFDLPPELIPGRLSEIAGYCGQQTALVLLLHYPGVHVAIPKNPAPTHKLAELLGFAAFVQLCALYGNEVIQIPRAAVAIRALRNQKILKDFSQGVYQATIALEHGLTERQVNKICNTVRIDRQLDIFAL